MTGAGTLVAAVTFEPTSTQLDRLVRQLLALGSPAVVWDNTPDADRRASIGRLCEAAGITLLGDGTNAGTGAALNAFTRLASESGAGWVTYLDQDSEVGPGFADTFEALADLPADVAAVGSRYDDAAIDRTDHRAGDGLEDSRFLIASGTSWRVSALQAVDGADESMFLDLVDHELCLRLQQARFRLVTDLSRHMHHAIGESGTSVGSRLGVTQHPRWRREMMWRNSVWLVRRYLRTFPLVCLRHALVRCVETGVGAVHFRDVGWLTSAARGAAGGLRRSRRVGLSG